MRSLPDSIGPIHFVGIGGIGMSGIAEVLHNLGYRVQGSDLADSANTRRLVGLGIPVRIGHAAENLDAAEVVVISSAVKPDNPEVVAARARRLPVVRRAEMLAELMRLKWAIAIAGTHGKTTTTSMIGAPARNRRARPDRDQRRHHQRLRHQYAGSAPATGWWSRPTRATAPSPDCRRRSRSSPTSTPSISISTATSPRCSRPSRTLSANIPFYGFAVLCIDHPVVQGMIPRVSDRRIVTYGFSPQADIRAANVRLGRDGSRFDAVDRRSAPAGAERRFADLILPMFGEHNVQNALTVIAVAEELGIGDEVVREALRKFAGVQAPLHQDRRVERRRDHRRLRPPSGRDRGGAEGGARRSRRAGSSRSCSRTAIPGSPICSTGSAPASTTPISCWSPMSTRPARRRSTARRGTRWSPGCARTATAARGRWPGRRSWRRLLRADGAAGRHGRVPRRRLDHELGERAARTKLAALARTTVGRMPGSR